MPWPYLHFPGLSQIARVSIESCAVLDPKNHRFQARENVKIWYNVVIETFFQKFNSQETAIEIIKMF